jgi:hypothetical protein
MPNWCENTLTVYGDKNELKKFVKKAKSKEEPLSLANLYPEPDYNKIKVKRTYPEISGDGYADPKEAWWDWRVQNWGTKWEITDVIYDGDEDGVEYSFMSAWSPPSDWLEKVGADYPKLDFILKYDEPGMCFMGASKSKQGVFSDNCTDYS